jgi:uncharacterized protein YkwD
MTALPSLKMRRFAIAIGLLLASPVGASPEEQAFVEAHRQVRVRHCAPPLRWSDKLAAVARSWAKKLASHGCALQHSRGAFGENLASGTSGSLDPASVVGMWAAEEKGYNFSRGGFSMTTGHFTQVVWRATTELGCARASCGSLDVFVCEYGPPGNVEGAYKENVAPPSCKR